MLDSNPGTSLFVGDLAVICAEADLIETFSPFGQIRSVRVMRTRKKLSLGYAFVALDTMENALAAMNALNGKPLCGRNMRIAFATQSAKSDKSSTNTNRKNILRTSSDVSNSPPLTPLTGGHSLHAQREAQLRAMKEQQETQLKALVKCDTPSVPFSVQIAATSACYPNCVLTSGFIMALFNHQYQNVNPNNQPTKVSSRSDSAVVNVELENVSDSHYGKHAHGIVHFVDFQRMFAAISGCSSFVHLDFECSLQLNDDLCAAVQRYRLTKNNTSGARSRNGPVNGSQSVDFGPGKEHHTRSIHLNPGSGHGHVSNDGRYFPRGNYGSHSQYYPRKAGRASANVFKPSHQAQSGMKHAIPVPSAVDHSRDFFVDGYDYYASNPLPPSHSHVNTGLPVQVPIVHGNSTSAGYADVSNHYQPQSQIDISSVMGNTDILTTLDNYKESSPSSSPPGDGSVDMQWKEFLNWNSAKESMNGYFGGLDIPAATGVTEHLF